MIWINLQTNIVRAPEYAGCEPVQRATWLNVLAYCAEQENGGIISDSRQWTDRRWQQTCGVTLKEVEAAAPLLSWEGNALVVWNYPRAKESEVQAKREAGRKGGRKNASSIPRSIALPTASSTLPCIASPTASSSPPSCALTEGEGKENGIGIGMERNHHPPAPPSSPAAPSGGETKMSGFELFWKAYPKKKARSDAARAWAAHGCAAMLEVILAKVASATRSHDWTRESGQYIPYPQKWLAQKRWEDEQPDAAAPSRPAGSRPLAYEAAIQI